MKPVNLTNKMANVDPHTNKYLDFKPKQGLEGCKNGFVVSTLFYVVYCVLLLYIISLHSFFLNNVYNSYEVCPFCIEIKIDSVSSSRTKILKSNFWRARPPTCHDKSAIIQNKNKTNFTLFGRLFIFSGIIKDLSEKS